MKNLIFFCIASAILLFSIVTINIAPIIGGLVGTNWMDPSCKYYSDKYDDDEKKSPNELLTTEDGKEEILKSDKKEIDRCNRKQAMVGLEYTSLNVNLIIGFICAFLGLLLYLNLGNLGKIPGLIGLVGGAIGFVLTLVYVIESGLVFNDIDGNNKIRIDSDGAYLKWKDSGYTCIFYDEDDQDSIYLKYSDYGNKYLSYNKDIFYSKDEKYKDINNNGCNDKNDNILNIDYSFCQLLDKKNFFSPFNSKYNNCDKIYRIDKTNQDNDFKIKYDRWLTSIILSCFISLFNIGLAIFGFLLFKESNGSSGSVAIK